MDICAAWKASQEATEANRSYSDRSPDGAGPSSLTVDFFEEALDLD